MKPHVSPAGSHAFVRETFRFDSSINGRKDHASALNQRQMLQLLDQLSPRNLDEVVALSGDRFEARFDLSNVELNGASFDEGTVLVVNGAGVDTNKNGRIDRQDVARMVSAFTPSNLEVVDTDGWNIGFTAELSIPLSVKAAGQDSRR